MTVEAGHFVGTSLGPMSSGKKSGRLESMLCMRWVSKVLLAVSKSPVPLASPHCKSKKRSEFCTGATMTCITGEDGCAVCAGAHLHYLQLWASCATPQDIIDIYMLVVMDVLLEYPAVQSALAMEGACLHAVAAGQVVVEEVVRQQDLPQAGKVLGLIVFQPQDLRGSEARHERVLPLI